MCRCLVRSPCFVVPGKIPCADGWLHRYEMVTEHFANSNLSMVDTKCRFLGFVVRDRTCICSLLFSLYGNPDMDDRIFDCLLASTAAVQTPEDVRASSCLWVIWMAIIRSGWVLRSTTTNRHGVAAFDFATAAHGRVGRVTDCGVGGHGFKSPASILTSRTEISSLS